MPIDVWNYVPTHPKSKYYYDMQTEAFLLGRERAVMESHNLEWLEKEYKNIREACETHPHPKMDAFLSGFKEVYNEIKAEEKK